MDVDYTSVDSLREALLDSGWHEVEHAPRKPQLRAGARVCNRGEQYGDAALHGTATVESVWRHGTDDAPDSWEQTYGRPNVEVIVRYDEPHGHIAFYYWADYGTHLAEIQPEPTETTP